MELLLFRRGRLFWPLAALMLLLSLLLISNLRYAAYGAWGNLCIAALLTSLVLSATTGSQLQRDRAQRLEGVVWSTPVSTAGYVLGKLVAALLVLLGLAGLMAAASVALEGVVKGQYPPLGPWPFVLTWPWLALPALVFGAALALALNTLTRRPFVSVIVVTLIWLLPEFSGPLAPEMAYVAGWPDAPDAAKTLGYTFGSAAPPTPELARQVIQLVQANVPWAHLTPGFYAGRVLFLALALLLIVVTVWAFGRQRRGKAY